MYVMVLGMALLVMVIGLGALNLTRVDRRTVALGQDFLEAQNYARSAIEVGLNLIHNTPTWRTTFAQGAWRSNLPLGRGTYSIDVIDTVDGNFANNQDDLLLMTGRGAIGEVQYRLAVNVAPYGPKGMSSLASAIHVGNYGEIETNCTATLTAPISTNNWMRIKPQGTVNGSAEAVNTIQVDGTLNGTETEGIAAKEIPTSSVFDYYIAQATVIPFAGLSGSIDKKILTPTYNNVGGGLNAQGIYLISCGGATIVIKKLRIHGTLILLDPKSDSVIEEEINWESTSSALPALMVRGSMTFRWTGSLSEAGAGTNFNPSNAPYGGVTDSDTSDTYPGKIKGLVYVSGDLRTESTETIEGALIVGNDLDVVANLTVTHDATLLETPPPGFEKLSRPMLPVEGTWRQVVD